jgi:hypothetical protein
MLANGDRRRAILRDPDGHRTERIEDRLDSPGDRRIVLERLKPGQLLPRLRRKRAPQPFKGIDKPMSLREERLALDNS